MREEQSWQVDSIHVTSGGVLVYWRGPNGQWRLELGGSELARIGSTAGDVQSVDSTLT